jgi:Ca-activated chloride channel family protein
MRHRPAAVLAIAVGLLAVVAAQERPTFHTATRLVVLHATVEDRSGALVTNLDRGAFAVYENGKRQPIAVFSRGEVLVSLGLVIDNSGSMRTLRPIVERAALAFVRASNPLDDVFVVNFADKARIDVPLTRDVHVLESGIARVDSIGGTAMRDAVLLAEGYLLAHASHDRRVLLLITDGKDNASRASIDELRPIVQRSETAVFAVGLFRDASASAGRGREELDHLTELTGGLAYYPASPDQIDAVVQEIAHRIRHEYTIAYAPTNQAMDGTYRTIRLAVSGPTGCSVRTRTGYWATRQPR